MSAPLYNREILRLAVALADHPLDAVDALPDARHAALRSPLCGSRVTLALTLDDAQRIAMVGIKADACALGQASAALMAKGAAGQREADMAAMAAAVAAWLAGDAPLPDWPGFDALAAAKDYPARHGSILLPFRAAVAAMRGGADAETEAAA